MVFFDIDNLTAIDLIKVFAVSFVMALAMMGIGSLGVEKKNKTRFRL